MACVMRPYTAKDSTSYARVLLKCVLAASTLNEKRQLSQGAVVHAAQACSSHDWHAISHRLPGLACLMIIPGMRCQHISI
jgi:UDP-N-acetylenolpyruvoylglucosamine reductase